jgi:hypothetical protein
MNRPFIPLIPLVALSVVVTLAGCAGNKKATTVAESAKPTKAAPPAAASTAPGVVRPGVFCKTTGVVGKTSGGAWARCQKKSGDPRPRWYVQAPGGKGARAGQFCSKQGATAKAASGAKLVCTKRAGEDRARWRTKK